MNDEIRPAIVEEIARKEKIEVIKSSPYGLYVLKTALAYAAEAEKLALNIHI